MRTAKHAGHHVFLCCGQTSAVALAAAGGHVGLDVEGGLASLCGLHHAVFGAVERIALVGNRFGHRLTFLRGEGAGQIRQSAVGVERVLHSGPGCGQRCPLLGPPDLRQCCIRQAIAGRTDQIAVVLVAHTRCSHHGVAPAVGAAANVRTVGPFAVSPGNQLFGHGRELFHGLVAVVQPGLWLQTEHRGLWTAVSGVRADHGKALHECARQRATTQSA